MIDHFEIQISKNLPKNQIPGSLKVLPCIPGTCLIPLSLILYFFFQEEKSFEAFSGAGQSLRKKGRR